jgi:hypothetical protein
MSTPRTHLSNFEKTKTKIEYCLKFWVLKRVPKNIKIENERWDSHLENVLYVENTNGNSFLKFLSSAF